MNQWYSPVSRHMRIFSSPENAPSRMGQTAAVFGAADVEQLSAGDGHVAFFGNAARERAPRFAFRVVARHHPTPYFSDEPSHAASPFPLSAGRLR